MQETALQWQDPAYRRGRIGAKRAGRIISNFSYFFPNERYLFKKHMHFLFYPAGAVRADPAAP